jgi:hypothetical protein
VDDRSATFSTSISGPWADLPLDQLMLCANSHRQEEIAKSRSLEKQICNGSLQENHP